LQTIAKCSRQLRSGKFLGAEPVVQFSDACEVNIVAQVGHGGYGRKIKLGSVPMGIFTFFSLSALAFHSSRAPAIRSSVDGLSVAVTCAAPGTTAAIAIA